MAQGLLTFGKIGVTYFDGTITPDWDVTKNHKA